MTAVGPQFDWSSTRVCPTVALMTLRHRIGASAAVSPSGRALACLASVATTAALVAFTSTARADPTASQPAATERADPDKVEWSEQWPRVKWWEVVAAASLTVGDVLYNDYVPSTDHATWTKPILFDSWARSVFRGQTASLQSAASATSDFFLKTTAFVPFIMDDYFAAASVHQNADVAWQLAAIDLQSNGLVGLISFATEHAVGRARPYTESCNANHQVVDAQGHLLQQCDTPNDDRSFYSGHATATAMAAGLVCVHHQHLPLFGGGFADLAPCLLMIGVSAATGVLRLVYDEHWASDVMTGWAIGVLGGYVMPSVMHFGFGGGRPLGEVHAGSLHMVPTILPAPGGSELGMVGVF